MGIIRYKTDHLNSNWDGRHGRNVWIEWQGDRLQVRVQKETKAMVPEPKRGEVSGFSDSSRFRCLKFVAGIDWKAGGECWFLTLTYPDTIEWHEPAIRQLHLSNFQTKLRRHYDRPIGFVWRTEWLPRKSGRCEGEIAPHFHLVVFNAPLLTRQVAWNFWMESIGEHVYADVWVEELYNAARVGLYIAKYAAKQIPLLGYGAYLGKALSGRAWGARYAGNIPRHAVKKWRTTENEKTREVMHVARGEATCWALGYNDSFTILGPAAKAMGEYMSRYTVDGEVPNV